ncbi:putative tRNA (guanine(9)-N(1))-methyltransferase [Helianthus annuus]|nr:putative tRNA (guanine(9)-N(1))-methyltransferase [Helianthus annuus]
MFTLSNLITSTSALIYKPNHQVKLAKMDATITTTADHHVATQSATTDHLSPPQPLSKNAQKKLLKQQRFEAKKAEKKAAMKEEKKRQGERKRKEWEEKLSNLSEEERLKTIEAKKSGQKVVLDLQFSELMAPNEIHSLVKQIMYCYSVNGRSVVPCHLWLTGYAGEIESQLQKMPGFDKWIIDKDTGPYINTFESQKENLVYLTADSENMLSELDLNKIYIIGGLVDRNRWKGITMKKAVDQGIQTAKLPIGNYLKMSGSQVLTVNQVIEILLKFLETKDWKESFFHVIPQRKRCETEEQVAQEEEGDEESEQGLKRQCIET